MLLAVATIYRVSSCSLEANESYTHSVIALIGDSLTWGLGASNRSLTSYPAVLRDIKGVSGVYTVLNFGDSGKTALNSTGKDSYWNTLTFQMALVSNPKIVVIQLGTNDAKKSFWNETQFKDNYIDMIRLFQRLKSRPAVYISIPPPLFTSKDPVYGIQPEVVNKVFPILIPDIAMTANKADKDNEFQLVKVIDVFSALGGVNMSFEAAFLIDKSRPIGKWPNDRCHLSDIGYRRIAETVIQAIL